MGLFKKSRNFHTKGFNTWITYILKKAKNIIKIKRNSVFFSLFVSVISY